jgi:hypothetical protein
MAVEDVLAVTIPLPKQVRTATFQVSAGLIVYNEAGKVCKVDTGKISGRWFDAMSSTDSILRS